MLASRQGSFLVGEHLCPFTFQRIIPHLKLCRTARQVGDHQNGMFSGSSYKRINLLWVSQAESGGVYVDR
ncbi:hypothetical protein D9M69_590190 [compost metagenome]